VIGLVAAAIPFALYLGWPSAFWNFDGVACAAAVELGNPVYWFHSQHLLYGFLGACFWKFLSAVMGLARALPALQLLSSLLSVLAAYFVYRLLLDRLGHRYVALLLSLCAATSAVVWIWSIEAQVYPLGYLGLAAATWMLLRPEETGRGWKVGIWHGVAILGHLVHGLWLIPATVYLWRQKNSLRAYWAALGATVFTAYAGVAVFVLRPYQGEQNWFAHWIKGSLGLTPDRSIAWHSEGWGGIIDWVVATPGTWWGSLGPGSPATVALFIKIATALSVALFLTGIFYALRGSWRSPLTQFSLIWIGVYAAFFSSWEPQTLCYRMTDVIPWTLLLASGLQALHSEKHRLIAAGGGLLSLILINLTVRIIPMNRVENNRAYQHTLQLVRLTPEQSVYLTGGGLPWIYLLYFTGRSAWNAKNLPEDRFKTFNQPVFAHTSLLADPRLNAWIQNHSAKQVAPELPWLELK